MDAGGRQSAGESVAKEGQAQKPKNRRPVSSGAKNRRTVGDGADVTDKLIKWVPIPALIVSALALVINFVQSKAATDQAALHRDEARPYVKYIPAFESGDGQISVMMISENLSPVPASVHYMRATAATSHFVNTNYWFSRNSDILYEHKNGGVELPPISKEKSVPILNGAQTLRIGTCAIYSAVSEDDTRLWEVDAIYEFVPGVLQAETVYSKDRMLRHPTEQCDPAIFLNQWLATH